MNKILIALLATVLFVSPYSPPQATISNGLITARLYLPDAENGYYRGTRFDWSGQIAELRYKGHSYFGQWFEKYDPYKNDAIMGPVEAFDPIGYEQAKVGERFIKIGVGSLVKPREDNYFFANDYQLVNGGKWEIQKRSNAVTFKHAFNEDAYGYVYTKRVRLLKNKPELVLEHTLKNTGKVTIETNVMNHNFLVIDSLTTGSDFVIKFPFDLQEKQTNEHKDAHVTGKEIHLESGDPRGKQFFLDDLKGYAAEAKDYNITVIHEKSGTGVTITSDRPFEKLNFWASVKTICPEPYIHVKAEPGKAFRWTTAYQFKAL